MNACSDLVMSSITESRLKSEQTFSDSCNRRKKKCVKILAEKIIFLLEMHEVSQNLHSYCFGRNTYILLIISI